MNKECRCHSDYPNPTCPEKCKLYKCVKTQKGSRRTVCVLKACENCAYSTNGECSSFVCKFRAKDPDDEIDDVIVILNTEAEGERKLYDDGGAAPTYEKIATWLQELKELREKAEVINDTQESGKVSIEYILEQCSAEHLGRRRFDGIEYHDCVDLDVLEWLLNEVMK